jgi:hypothetical protein
MLIIAAAKLYYSLPGCLTVKNFPYDEELALALKATLCFLVAMWSLMSDLPP